VLKRGEADLPSRMLENARLARREGVQAANFAIEPIRKKRRRLWRRAAVALVG